ncbi:MAG: sulfatase-like hydrolase/transferase [Bacteroidales bacterium]|nr:sulfatase-like hydrolase/transferase [Bacteroidales bacterium]
MKIKSNAFALGGYAVPALLWTTLFVQVVLFQWACYHNLLITSLWKSPDHFLVFWLSKIGIALFLASFALLSKRKWWTVAIVALVSLWCLSNLIYYRANNMVLSFAAITMAGNLSGFQSSILAYWNIHSTLFLLIPILYSLALIPLQAPTSRRPLLFFCLLAIIALSDVGLRYLYRKHGNQYNSFSYYILPWRDFSMEADKWVVLTEDTHETNRYISYHSIVSNLPRIIAFHHATQYNARRAAEMRVSQNAVPPEVSSLYTTATDTSTAPCNLIIMLVESLESWVIDATDDHGRKVAPCLNTLAGRSLYFPHCQSQAKEGVSGDGQLIVNTGILPLQQGAACMIFGNNAYPNLASTFRSSATIIPTLTTTWNQTVASFSYGYHETVSEGEIGDEALFQLTQRWLDTVGPQPFCLQMLTVSTHTPFDRVQHNPLHFNSDMPAMLRDYLGCIHYADSCIGDFMAYLGHRGLLDSTIVVITGDHTVFKDNLLREYRKAATQRGYDIQSGHNFVPLLILSPDMGSPRLIADTCGQYDIYPTLRHLLGAERYPWKGLGRNLLDTSSTRPFSEAEAYRWSDIIIRSNWFSDKIK